MAFVHKSVNDMSHQYLINERRYNYTTPKSFLELVGITLCNLKCNMFLSNCVLACVVSIMLPTFCLNVDQPLPVSTSEEAWRADKEHGEVGRRPRETQEYCCPGVHCI